MRPNGDPPTPSVARVPPARTPHARKRRPGPPDYRPGRADEALALASIWEESIADYERGLARPIFPADLGPVAGLIGHLAGTDPDHFWVAERRGRPVGFSMASLRGDLWFLGLLFVLPAEQANGVGRELLGRTLPRAAGDPGDAAGPGPILGTVTDSAQPISNALYARAGIVPRLPAWRVVGRPIGRSALDALGPLPDGVTAVGIAAQRGMPEVTLGEAAIVAALDGLDGALLGRTRPADHAWRRAAGRAYLYRGPDDSPVGYAYVTPAGSIGPVAVLDPALLAPVVGHLLDAHPPAGASAVTVTGDAPDLLRALLAAGFRLDGFPALVCWTRPFAPHDRYLLGSYALP